MLEHGYRLRLNKRKLILVNITLALTMVLFENLARLLTSHQFLTPVWCSGGIALAALLTFGKNRVSLGVLLGYAIIAFQTNFQPLNKVFYFFSNLSEPFLAALLLKYYGRGIFRFKSLKDIIIFVVIGAVLVPFAFTTWMLIFLHNSKIVVPHEIPEIFRMIFSSHVLGILILTPFLTRFFVPHAKKANKLEGVLFVISLIIVSLWGFEDLGPKTFLIIPILTWASLRLGHRGVGLSAMILGLIVFMDTVRIPEILVNETGETLFWIQCLLATATLVGYLLASVREIHASAQEKELENFINLEHKKIAEEALAILDQSIMKSPIGFALLDKKLRYIRINERLAEINDISVGEHLGRTFRSIRPEYADDVEVVFARIFETGESRINIPVTTYNKKKETEVFGLVSYYPVKHPMTDEIFAVAISFQDITEQLQTQNLLMENEARLSFAQEVGKSGAFEWNIKTNEIFWTHEMEAIYGLEPGEFGGLVESWLKWIHPDDLENLKEEVNAVLKNDKELNIQFRIITGKHDVRWVLARAKMIVEQGGVKKIIGINIDFTEQKNSEQRLKITEANLLHALSVRDEFMAIASHELKTPLTSLKLQSELYQRYVKKGNPSYLEQNKIDEMLEKNLRQIARLTRLVDDMLDISRIRTGKLTLRREICDLSKIVEDVIHRNREQFMNSGSGLPEVKKEFVDCGEWDPFRIEQVVTNIITNAIRYGGGKKIQVRVKNMMDRVRLEVEDQGLGIPPSDQIKIFQRYERGLLSRSVSGLGLGLFISKQIIESHGGNIWVQSEVSNGSTFYVELPYAAEIKLSHEDPELIPASNL